MTDNTVTEHRRKLSAAEFIGVFILTPVMALICTAAVVGMVAGAASLAAKWPGWPLPFCVAAGTAFTALALGFAWLVVQSTLGAASSGKGSK